MSIDLSLLPLETGDTSLAVKICIGQFKLSTMPTGKLLEQLSEEERTQWCPAKVKFFLVFTLVG